MGFYCGWWKWCEDECECEREHKVYFVHPPHTLTPTIDASLNPFYPSEHMYTRTTRHIKIIVHPVYLEEQSLPEEEHYVWAYTIQLENLGEETVQLLSRYWHITDAQGRVQEVRGSGVVGEQPVLKPGEQYQYTSGAALHTPSGIMTGNYEMQTDGGEHFHIDIPAFSLDSPIQMERPN